AIYGRLRNALHTAYGLSREQTNLLDTEHDIDEHLRSLANNHQPSLEHGYEFPEALEDIARQAIEHKYSHAPALPDQRLCPKQVEEMHEALRGAIDSEENSYYVDDKSVRQRLKDYAKVLDLGDIDDTRITAKRHWRNKIQKELQPGDDPVEVGAIYDLIDPDDEPTGLPDELKDLIVLTYADMEDMLVERRGKAVEVGPGDLRGSDKLVHRRMPSDEAWKAAREVAEGVFGLDPPKMKNARSVQRLAEMLREAAGELERSSARRIGNEIAQIGKHYLGMTSSEVTDTPRYRYAQKMAALMDAFDESGDATDLIEAVADVGLAGDDLPAVQKSFRNARSNLGLIERINWEKSFATLQSMVENRSAPGAGPGLMQQARDALAAPEHAQPLSKFNGLEDRVFDLIIDDDPTPDFYVRAEKNWSPDAAPQEARSWLDEHLEDYEGDEIEVTIELKGGGDDE
ncbi:MAG: hypothetical protein ABEN55_06580, partial [Bradymonadaceae bacterium]